MKLRSIRSRLALVFGGLVVLVLLTAVALSRQALEQSVRARVDADVAGVQWLLARDIQGLRQLTALEVEKAFRFNSDVAGTLARLVQRRDDAALGLEDEGEGPAPVAVLRGELRELIESTEMPVLKGHALFAVVGKDRELVFTESRPGSSGEQLASTPLLELALSGQGGAAAWCREELERQPVRLRRDGGSGALLVVAVPITLPGGGVVGAVLVGTPAEQVIQGLERSTRGRVALVDAHGHAITTGDAGFREAVERVAGERQLAFSLGGASYVGDGFAPGNEVLLGGRALLLRDLAQEQGEFFAAFFGSRFLLSLGVLGVLSLGLTLAVSRRLARPLRVLESQAEAVRQGNLDVHVQPEGHDEVARLTHAFNEMVAGLKQRDHIKGLFKRYLDPRVVEQLIANPEMASPGGERRELTLLFSDLAGFTRFSERLTPEELVRLLNTYFGQATAVLGRREATLDKFIGDAIMCFWNAPLRDEAHAAKGCLAALDLLSVVDGLRGVFAEAGVTSFDCRIGVHTGAAVVGNLGSPDAQDYTAVGDSVNLASRLEGACKVYGTRTLASEAAVRAAGGAVHARELDVVRVVGRSEPVRVYELVGPGELPPPPLPGRWAEALALYREGRFAEALVLFQLSPEDGPSQLYAERCEAWLAGPPPAPGAWRVHDLTSK
ncbi:MAG: hypothetical protein RL653_2948 [Pseudomonadota bacterium]